MISPFTPEELGLVSSLIRSRYLADTPVEDVGAGVQLDPAQATLTAGPGLCWEAGATVHCGVVPRGTGAAALRRAHDGEPVSLTISRQPTREVHHPEGVFVAHWSD